MTDTKGSMDSVIPPEVNELIGESQKIQGWIEKLAELRDETTPAVHEKVQTDYRARLAEVTSRLAEHQSDLGKTLDERRTGVEKLRAERDEQAADLEEAKLRFAVGEYGSDEWDERRGRIERGLQSLKDRLATEDAALEELEAILASIPAEGAAKKKGTQKPAWMAGVAAADSSVDDVSVQAEAEAAGEEPAKEAEETEDTPADETEKTAVAAAAVDSDEAVKESKGEGDEGEYLDELEFLESLSLEESDRFDAVSAMLDDEEGGKGGSE